MSLTFKRIGRFETNLAPTPDGQTLFGIYAEGIDTHVKLATRLHEAINALSDCPDCEISEEEYDRLVQDTYLALRTVREYLAPAKLHIDDEIWFVFDWDS